MQVGEKTKWDRAFSSLMSDQASIDVQNVDLDTQWVEISPVIISMLIILMVAILPDKN